LVLLVAGLALAAGVAASMSGGGTEAQARWVITDLGTLGGAESYAAAINSKGRVVGWAEAKSGGTRPVLWRNGRIRDLGTFGARSAWATGINNLGRVVGGAVYVCEGDECEEDSARFGVVWERGSMAQLESGLAYYDSGGDSDVRAINERGQMVGWANVDTGEDPLAQHAMLWSYSGSVPPRHDLEGRDLNGKAYQYTQAYDVNERGQVVGEGQKNGSYKLPYHAVLWQSGKLVDLGTLPGRTESSAVAVNDRGQIVGSCFNQAGKYGERKARMRAFLWQEGEMLDLGTIAGMPHSSGVALNESGQVIGWSAKKALGEDEDLPKSPRAFFWQDGELTDLGTLGGVSAIPFAINAAGQIVGQSQNAKGEWRAFVWETWKMTALPTLGGKFSAALAINDKGQIVGWSRTPNGVKHAVFWTLRRG